MSITDKYVAAIDKIAGLLKANPAVKVSDGKGHIKEVVKDVPKVKEVTKAKLIKELKGKGLTAQDLAKLADASTLMAAAQLALVEAK